MIFFLKRTGFSEFCRYICAEVCAHASLYMCLHVWVCMYGCSRTENPVDGIRVYYS
jgi:hypothetical protein